MHHWIDHIYRGFLYLDTVPIYFASKMKRDTGRNRDFSYPRCIRRCGACLAVSKEYSNVTDRQTDTAPYDSIQRRAANICILKRVWRVQSRASALSTQKAIGLVGPNISRL